MHYPVHVHVLDGGTQSRLLYLGVMDTFHLLMLIQQLSLVKIKCNIKIVFSLTKVLH